MTPQQRAEKILLHHNKWRGSPKYNAIEFIITQIEDAQREAVEWKVKEMLSEPGMMLHWKDGHDKGYAEGFRAGMNYGTQDAFDKGFNAAREKAKEFVLADGEEQDHIECHCETIAQRIREMEP